MAIAAQSLLSILNKIVYINENITVKTNNFLILIEPVFEGTTTVDIEGTGILEVM